MRTVRHAVIGALLAGALTACRDSLAPNNGITRVALTPGGPVVVRNVGDTVRFTATPLGASDAVVTGYHPAWTSSNESVVTISATGLLTAVGPGSAQITADVAGIRAVTSVVVPTMLALRATPDMLVAVDSTATLQAFAQYSDGPVWWSRPASWSVRDTTLATVTVDGVLRAKSRVGSTWAVASAGGLVDSMHVSVWNPGFYVWPDTNVVPLGTTRPLRAEAFSTKTGVRTVAGAAWSSSDPAVASVDGSGVVTPQQVGHATIAAEQNGVRATAEVYVVRQDVPLRFTSLGTAIYGSCGLNSDGRAYCWGDQQALIDSLTMADRCELVNYDSYLRSFPYWRTLRRCAGTPTLASQSLRFSTLMDGPAGLTTDGALYSLSVVGPKEIAPGVRFRQASLGIPSCGVTTEDRGYCWGGPVIGDGTALDLGPYASTPQELSGGLRWRLVTSWAGTACGIDTGGATYCWGSNIGFRLGVGPDSTVRGTCFGACVAVPTRVQTTETFVTLATRGGDTCALTAAGAVYCWGTFPTGGAAASLPHAQAGVPVRVDAPPLRALRGAQDALCGLAADGGAYCLVHNTSAADLASVFSFTRLALPFPVRELSVGQASSCAISDLDGLTYCWGFGRDGRLGDGRFVDAPITAPALVGRQ